MVIRPDCIGLSLWCLVSVSAICRYAIEGPIWPWWGRNDRMRAAADAVSDLPVETRSRVCRFCRNIRPESQQANVLGRVLQLWVTQVKQVRRRKVVYGRAISMTDQHHRTQSSRIYFGNAIGAPSPLTIAMYRYTQTVSDVHCPESAEAPTLTIDTVLRPENVSKRPA